MKKHISLIALPLTLLFLAACHPRGDQKGTPPAGPDSVHVIVEPQPGPSPADVQARLVAQYERGEIEQCLTDSLGIVYRCSRNAPDAGTEIYDARGNRVGRCYASTNSMDALCSQTRSCKVIYRMERNIWGKPAVPWVRPE